MKAGLFHLELYEGTEYHRKLRWKSADVLVPLANYAGVVQIRHPTVPTTVLLEVPKNDGLILRDTDPNIEITISQSRVAALDIVKTTWRLLLTPPGGSAIMLLEGDVLKEW